VSSQYQVQVPLSAPFWKSAIIGLSLLASCVFIIGQSVLASEATTDLLGSADADFLERFPRSHIVMYETTEEIESRTLVYGSLKKINNVLTPRKAMIIDGALTRITYRIPDGSRSSQVIKYFHSQLQNQGEILFFCQRQQCGSSNYWANNIFLNATLYGPEEYQNLIVASVLIEDRQIFISVYAIQRGNLRGYVHVEILDSGVEAGQPSNTILKKLKSDGFYNLQGLHFDALNNLINETDELKTVIKLLGDNPSMKLTIVGHSGPGISLEVSLGESLLRAENVAARIASGGVSMQRLSAHGVGTLAPMPASTKSSAKTSTTNDAGNRIVLLPGQD